MPLSQSLISIYLMCLFCSFIITPWFDEIPNINPWSPIFVVRHDGKATIGDRQSLSYPSLSLITFFLYLFSFGFYVCFRIGVSFKMSLRVWTLAIIPNWTWSCSSLLSFDTQIFNLWQTLCTDPNMWLTLEKPFDCCSWFAIASHRNTNEIFNIGAREFAWLQNPKAYKKRNKNSFV